MNIDLIHAVMNRLSFQKIAKAHKMCLVGEWNFRKSVCC
jgi:hypothetical protein